MYMLNKFCCICMNKSDLKHLFDVDNEGVSLYNKLTSCIVEMDFKEMNGQRLICGECCVTLNTVYNFRQMCLRSKTNLITYISQLKTCSRVSGTLSVCLTDIKHNMVKKEIKIKCENEESSSSFAENNPPIECKTESYEGSIQFPASVKEECESEDDASPAHKDATVDHGNEGTHSDVEDETNMEDADYAECSEIGTKQHPLVKGEPMSDTETPQDGNTGQATSEQPKECEICKKIFSQKYSLKRHMLVHLGESPYKCEICKKTISSKSNLTKHMLVHSGIKPYKCEICKKTFTANGNLTKHMLVHSGERPHKCEICMKKFSLKGDLTRHMLLHSGEKPYKCEICKKIFTQKGHLTNHMLVHSCERPHKCEICKKIFSLKGDLTRHLLVHSGVKPYKCEICKKIFTQKGHLNTHMQVHSGERPYKCEICEKAFTQRGTLKIHMQRHSR